MTQEDYLTYEQAKELKELGFPFEKTRNYDYPIIGFTDDNNEYIYPTLSLAQKWLREEKDILLTINPIYNPLDEFVGFECEIRHHYTEYNKSGIYRTTPFSKTYEDALSAGIDKCIEVLKNN